MLSTPLPPPLHFHRLAEAEQHQTCPLASPHATFPGNGPPPRSRAAGRTPAERAPPALPHRFASPGLPSHQAAPAGKHGRGGSGRAELSVELSALSNSSTAACCEAAALLPCAQWVSLARGPCRTRRCQSWPHSSCRLQPRSEGNDMQGQQGGGEARGSRAARGVRAALSLGFAPRQSWQQAAADGVACTTLDRQALVRAW